MWCCQPQNLLAIGASMLTAAAVPQPLHQASMPLCMPANGWSHHRETTLLLLALWKTQQCPNCRWHSRMLAGCHVKVWSQSPCSASTFRRRCANCRHRATA